MNALVSIVIPSFNNAGEIREAVESALLQSYRPLEVICVDDGSSDGTLRVLEQLRESYPEHLTVLAQRNAGACAARNAGLGLARGEYVQFLDADDVLLPAKITHQVTLARQVDDPDIIAGSHRRRRLDGTEEENTCTPVDPWIGLVMVKLGTTSPNLFRREAVVDVGGWKEGLKSSQEYDLMFRMLKHGCRIVFDPEPLTIMRQRAGSITSINLEENDVRRIEHVAEVRDYVRQNGLRHEAFRAAETALFDTIRSLCNKNLERGVEAFTRYLPAGYKPRASTGTTPGYLLAYNALGFRRTEKLRAVLRGKGGNGVPPA